MKLIGGHYSRLNFSKNLVAVFVTAALDMMRVTSAAGTPSLRGSGDYPVSSDTIVRKNSASKPWVSVAPRGLGGAQTGLMDARSRSAGMRRGHGRPASRRRTNAHPFIS